MKPNFSLMSAAMLDRAQAEKDRALTATPNPYKGARLLIVDDDPTQRLLAREALETAGFEVYEAADGPEGIVTALRTKPDLVILDIIMPMLDGFTVCSELRNHRATKDIPILIATGLDDAPSIERGFVLGANDFISKPIAWPTLALRVKYMLRNANAARVIHARSVTA